LMRDPSLILLDEPAAGVNRTLLNDLLHAVRRLRDEGKTVLLVEHDMKVVMGLCEVVFVLDHGDKIAEGPPGIIQADERVIEAYFGREAPRRRPRGRVRRRGGDAGVALAGLAADPRRADHALHRLAHYGRRRALP